MAIVVEFNANAAREVLNRIGRGEGIPAPATGHWTDRHALLAAACLLMAVRASAPVSEEPLHREHAEARREAIQRDLAAAVFWAVDRCEELQRGVYFERFEEVARVIIGTNDERVEIVACEGIKPQKPKLSG